MAIWHPEAIAAGAVEALHAFRERSLLGDAYLAGGTALALHFGHRVSVVLDFFVPELFDEDALLARIQAVPDFSLVEKNSTLSTQSLAAQR